MKDFNNMTEQQLKNVLTFTTALADRIEQDGQINFGEMETTDESLREVEKSAREFAARRKANLIARSTYGKTDTEEQEVNEIRAGIKGYYRRTGKVVKG
jgi:tellurite resistance protein